MFSAILRICMYENGNIVYSYMYVVSMQRDHNTCSKNPNQVFCLSPSVMLGRMNNSYLNYQTTSILRNIVYLSIKFCLLYYIIRYLKFYMYCCIKSASFFQLSQLPFETNIASMVMVWSVIPSSSIPTPIHRLLMQLLWYCISKKATIFLIRELIQKKSTKVYTILVRN